MKKLFVILWVLVLAAAAAAQCPIKTAAEKIVKPLICLDTLGRSVQPDSAHITTYKDDASFATYFARSTTFPFTAASIDTTRPPIGGTAPVLYWLSETISTIDGTATNATLAINVQLWWKGYATDNMFCVQMVADSLNDVIWRLAAYLTAAPSTLVATDNIGINWADVSNPTTTVGLTGTTISTGQVISFDNVTGTIANSQVDADVDVNVLTASAGSLDSADFAATARSMIRTVDLDYTVGTLAKTTDITGFNDLAATDNIGINWADVSNPTTTLGLTNTTVGIVTTTTTATNLTNAPTSGDLTATMKTSVENSVWDAAKASHTTASSFGVGVYIDTANAGHVGLSGIELVDLVFDEAIAGHTTAGTAGAYIKEVHDSLDTQGWAATGAAAGGITEAQMVAMLDTSTVRSVRDALGDTVGTFATPHALTDSMRLVSHDSTRLFVQGVKDKTDSLKFAGVMQNPSFLQPTTSGNRLDVTAAGLAGLDFDNTTGTLAKTTDITGFNDIAATAVVSSGAITTSGGAVSTVTTTTTATNVTTLNGIANNAITAASIADAAFDSLTFAGDAKKMIALRADSGASGSGASAADVWAYGTRTLTSGAVTASLYPIVQSVTTIDAPGALPKFQFEIDTASAGGSNEYGLLNTTVLIRDADDGHYYFNGIIERVNCVADQCTLQVSDSCAFAFEAGDSVWMYRLRPEYVIASLSEAAAAVASTSLEGAYADSTLGGLLKLIAEGAGAAGFDSTLFLEMLANHGWYATFDTLGLRVTRGNSYSGPVLADMLTIPDLESSVLPVDLTQVQGDTATASGLKEAFDVDAIGYGRLDYVDSAGNAGTLTVSDADIDSIAARTAALVNLGIGSAVCLGDGLANACTLFVLYGVTPIENVYVRVNNTAESAKMASGFTDANGRIIFNLDSAITYKTRVQRANINQITNPQSVTVGANGANDTILVDTTPLSNEAVIIGNIDCENCPVRFALESVGQPVTDTSTGRVITDRVRDVKTDEDGFLTVSLPKTGNMLYPSGTTRKQPQWKITVAKTNINREPLWSFPFSIPADSTQINIGELMN